MIPRPSRGVRGLSALALLAGGLACGDGVPGEAPAIPESDETPAAPVTEALDYERSLVFMTAGADSALWVPWLFSASSRPEGVAREVHASLYRGGMWEPFLSEAWETPPSRAAWRILPRGPLRLVVSEGEALERIIYAGGTRELEVELGDVLAEWTGARGETFRLLDGGLILGDRRTRGLVLDVVRTREPSSGAPGDWMLLVSGDSLQVVLHAPPGPAHALENPFRGWARLGFGRLDLPDVSIDWAEVRPFEPARRDVPVAWELSAESVDMTGRLDVSSSQLEAGVGEGAILPVSGLFEVTGTLTIRGSRYPVRGLIRHIQT